MTKRTPKQWKVKKGTSIIETGGDLSIMVVSEIAKKWPKEEADSIVILISASPDLLEACEFAYNETSGTPRPEMWKIMRDKLKKAIEKAKDQ